MALAESVRARLFPEDASLPAVPRPLGSGRAQPQWDSLGTAADGAAAAADALAPPTWGHNGQGGQGLPAFSWRRRPRGHRPWSSLVRRRCTRSPESSGKGGAKVRRSCPCTSTRPASPQQLFAAGPTGLTMAADHTTRLSYGWPDWQSARPWHYSNHCSHFPSSSDYG